MLRVQDQEGITRFSQFMVFILLLAACFLAYSNGANDNFKGVASLFGSKTASYGAAIRWATITTFGGSVCSTFLASTLLTRFSGRGLVPEHIVGTEHFLLAVAMGAGITVIAATLAGFPISTTHGLTGAMLGSGLVAAGRQVNFQSLRKGFLLPLLLSPLLAVVLASALYLLLNVLRLYSGSESHSPDAAHFLSAGVVSFARGLNDTPKIAAMLLVLKTLDAHWASTAVATAMAIGGLLNAKRVAETMSLKITAMNHTQGFAANLATGVLVILASRYGLPVSTTHVSVGSLFGIGLTTRNANVRIVLGILLSWVLTLPCAALIAAFVFWLAPAR